MKRCYHLFITSLLVLVVTLAIAKPPVTNLDFIKQKLINYNTSGQYAKEVAAVFNEASAYLEERVAANQATGNKKRLAVVMDIDETSLSNYSEMAKENFGGNKDELMQAMLQGQDSAIKPALAFYQLAQSKDVAVFFVTGRFESMRAATAKNLQAAGYKTWQGLFLKPNNYNKSSVVPYKSGARHQIEAQGYDVILTIGDQWSDLKGGYADKQFKVPNPYYYIP
ncbi:MAG: hypothetical protein A3E87_00995 [Gammaproteobacteria bacterium RIFCSPHIGHO2_12_FULL_35_23]|nr:MAG: hypothetical protein A3E87_00995 [Gammaproteobacteria bacterium RIFCSPHIGHO2_12_FULL_35_23]